MRSVSALILVCLGCTGGAPLDSAELEVRSPARDCDSDRFPPLSPTGSTGALSCCQDRNKTWHVNDPHTLVYREYGPPCREADGIGTSCGAGSSPFVPCAYGP